LANSDAESSRGQRRREAVAQRRAERRAGGAPARPDRTGPNWELLVPALVGVALASYLSAIAWRDGTPLACGVGSGCEAVQGSRFASLLGVPMAARGALVYAALAGIAWRLRSARWHSALALAVSGPQWSPQQRPLMITAKPAI